MRIVEGMRPYFRGYCDQYDTGKYWPQTYQPTFFDKPFFGNTGTYARAGFQQPTRR